MYKTGKHKLLEDNRGDNLDDLHIGDYFLDTRPDVQPKKKK